jgi:hypothetical protein
VHQGCKAPGSTPVKKTERQTERERETSLTSNLSHFLGAIIKGKVYADFDFHQIRYSVSKRDTFAVVKARLSTVLQHCLCCQENFLGD